MNFIRRHYTVSATLTVQATGPEDARQRLFKLFRREYINPSEVIVLGEPKPDEYQEEKKNERRTE